jgi:uncharacterized protein (TIGR03643 family)
MKPKLTPIDIEQIILMAWGDTIPFETIKLEYNLSETEVRKLMRANQSEKTYIRWRTRVESRSGSSSKHATLSTKTSTKQKY